MFLLGELRRLGIKTIRELTHREFFATKYDAKRAAQKHSKGFCLFFSCLKDHFSTRAPSRL